MRLLLVLSLLCGASIIWAQTESNMEHELSVLSWNTAFLPSLSAKKKYAPRAEEVAQLILNSDADVIALQEVFPKRIFKQIRSDIESVYPNMVTSKRKQFLIWQHSGLYVFSKNPIQYLSETKFRMKSGFDKFAKKGALLVKGMKNDKPFHLVVTHMQSFPGPANHEIRMIQLDRIRRELIEPFSVEGQLLVMVGDFNVNRHRRSEHGDMLQVIGLEDATMDLADQNSFVGFNSGWENGRTMFFDHVLFNGYARINHVEFLDMRSSLNGQNLSDHKPLLAKFHF